MKPDRDLKDSDKVELLALLFGQKSIRSVLNSYSSQQLVEAHAFLWDKLIEIHYLTQNTPFRRESVTKGMLPSAAYQHRQGCDLRLDYCKGVECIWSYPVCAGNKVKNHMEVMANTISIYLESFAQPPDNKVFTNTDIDERRPATGKFSLSS